MRRVIQLLSLLAVMAITTAASAQDRDKFAVVASTQEPIGIVWHVTDKIAVRPAIDFAHGSSSTEGDPYVLAGVTLPARDPSFTTFGLQLSGLLYLARWDDLRAYVAPGYGHTWVSQDQYSFTESSNHQVEGLLGLQYSLGSRFAVFGEFGLSYARVTRETTIDFPFVDVLPVTPGLVYTSSSIKTTMSATGTRSRFGVAFYLK